MTITVEAPGGISVEFPDGTPREVMTSAMQQRFGNPQPETWGHYAGGLARQAIQGATFGFGDEAEARLRALLGEDYDTTVADIRRQNRQFASEHPIASTVAGIGGGVLPFLTTPGAAIGRLAVGSTLPRTIARSAAVGAGAGGLSGLGAGEGSLAERLPSAAEGALVGAGVGAVIPPVLAGAGRALTAGGQVVSAADRLLRGARTSRPSEGYVPPVPPVGGRPIEGATFTADGVTPEAMGAQEGALRLISDWITSAGGSIDGLQNAFERAQRSRVLHSSGRALNAQTLAELYPPLQRLLRAGASGYREVGEDVMRFLQARQTGILPPGASAQDLATRGIPTRERFMAGRTVGENADQFGVQLGSGQGNITPTGQLGRLVDATKRLFRISDFDFHGHASTAGRTSDEILQAMRQASDPAYKQAFGVGDVVHVDSTIAPILERWQAQADAAGKSIRQTLTGAIREFQTKGGQPMSRLRDFDQAKQALDDRIGVLMRAGERYKAGQLTQLKNELLGAVDGIKTSGLGDLYSQARGIYAKGARDNDILESFKTAWKDDHEEVVKRYDALPSPEDKKLARLGIVWGMESENAAKRASQDATLGFDVNRAERMLTLIGQRVRAGKANATKVMRRFGDYVAGEQEMVRGTARTAIGGSMTDRNLQDAMSMGSMEIMQNIQTWGNLWRGSSSMFEVGRKLTEWAIDRAFGLSADRAREMSRMLLTANPDEIRNIIARLRMMMPANRMARFSDLMQRLQLAVGPSTGVAGAAAGAVTGAPTPITSETTFL